MFIHQCLFTNVYSPMFIHQWSLTMCELSFMVFKTRIIDMPGWVARRDKSLSGVLRGCSRLAHKWHYKYTMPVKGSAAYAWHVIVPLSLLTLYASYERYEAVRLKKYH